MKNEPIALKLNVGWVALGYTDPNKDTSRFRKEDNLEINLQTFCYLRQESLVQEIFLANNYNSHDLMDSENMKLSARYKKINHLLRSNWKRLQEEYFPTLRKLNKWYTTNYTLKKDDTVLVLDEKLAGRDRWKKGRVIDVEYCFKGERKLISKIHVKIAPTINVVIRYLWSVCPISVIIWSIE